MLVPVSKMIEKIKALHAECAGSVEIEVAFSLSSGIAFISYDWCTCGCTETLLTNLARDGYISVRFHGFDANGDAFGEEHLLCAVSDAEAKTADQFFRFINEVQAAFGDKFSMDATICCHDEETSDAPCNREELFAALRTHGGSVDCSIAGIEGIPFLTGTYYVVADNV